MKLKCENSAEQMRLASVILSKGGQYALERGVDAEMWIDRLLTIGALMSKELVGQEKTAAILRALAEAVEADRFQVGEADAAA